MEGNTTEKFLACLVTPFQSLENALQQLLTERSVDTAVGAQLDVIGRLVGQPRNGMVDADFRRLVRARVSVNRSTGNVENILTVTDLVVYDDLAYYKVENQGTATVKLTIEEIAVATVLANRLMGMLEDTVSAGVRLVVQYGISPPAEWFRLDLGLGLDQGKLVGALDNV